MTEGWLFSPPSTTPVCKAVYSSPQAVGTPLAPNAFMVLIMTGEAMTRIFIPFRSAGLRMGFWLKKLRAPEVIQVMVLIPFGSSCFMNSMDLGWFNTYQ